MYRKYLIVILCVVLMPGFVVAEKLKFATLEWEPYIYSHSDHGYVGQLVKMAFSESGYEVSYDFFPWVRTVQKAKSYQYAGYFPEYYSEERVEDFYFSDPFPGGPLVFFKRKEHPVFYSSLTDLKQLTIGVVRGYVNTKEFDEATYLKKDFSISDLHNLRKLLAGRIDLVVADKYVGYHLVKTHMPDMMEYIGVVDPPLEQKSLYLCVSKRHPDALKILQAFNQGLAQMRDNGAIEKISKSLFEGR